MQRTILIQPRQFLALFALVLATRAPAATLIDMNWQSYDTGTALTAIPGWSVMAGSDNTPVIAVDAGEPGNKFLTTGTENNQPSRHAFSFSNPGFDASTTLTFTVDMFDPFVNPQSSLSTLPRAYLGIFELGGDASMPSYFGMENDDSSSDVTTAEWVVAGENFGTPAGAPRTYSSEGSISQDTWYTVRSVWNLGANTKSLEVKLRDSAESFTTVFSNVPIGFLNPTQDFSELNALGIRLNRGTRLDKVRVEYTPAALAGDYNGDLIVNAADYTLWRDTLHSTTDLRADGDNSGAVDQADYDFWAARFGNSRLPQHLSHYAEAPQEVVGGPARSDVMFSVRSFFSSPSNYPQVAAAFHATRNDWTYAAHIQAGVNALGALGMTSGGAMHASVHNLPSTNPGIARHWDGVTPLAHSASTGYSGDVNAPEYRQAALQILKNYIDAGNIRIQWDDPRMNTEFVLTVGGSFASASVAKYRDWLAENTTTAERIAAGLPGDLLTFDYRVFVAERNGIVSNEATELWMTFHYESSIDFFDWIQQEISNYAGFEVPFSGNNLGYWDVAPGSNSYRSEYIGLYRWFDYGIGELTTTNANPQFILNSVRRAEELGKTQFFTLTNSTVSLNRRVLSYTYAVGGHMIMPWDVYIPNSPRFFGNPNDYNDITSFVRDNAQLFDGYENAAYVGPALIDERTAMFEPMTIESGSGQLYAFARAKPGDLEAAVVVHLVEWSTSPQPFRLLLRNDMFAWPTEEPITALLYRPESGDLQFTGVIMANGYTAFDLPALTPYGLLIVSRPLGMSTAIPEPTSATLLSILCITFGLNACRIRTAA